MRRSTQAEIGSISSKHTDNKLCILVPLAIHMFLSDYEVLFYDMINKNAAYACTSSIIVVNRLLKIRRRDSTEH